MTSMSEGGTHGTESEATGAKWVHGEAVAVALRELPSYCTRQRWYPAKDAGAPALALDVIVPLNDCGAEAAVALWHVSAGDREPFLALIPLAVVAAGAQSDAHQESIGMLSDGRRLIDATQSDSFIKRLVQLMLNGSQSRSTGLSAGHTEQIAGLRAMPESRWSIKRSSVEQSNTSIRVADNSILKVLRRIAPGIHPELEMGRFLTEVAHFRAIPALLGWVNIGDRTIAILQEFVPNEGDGWTWTRGQLQRGAVGSEAATKWLVTLGKRTAELHVALSAPSADTAFQAETVAHLDWQRWSRDLSAMWDRVCDALENAAPNLDNETLGLARELRKYAGVLTEWLTTLVAFPPVGHKIRHHGDYHLGQVLVSGEDAVIVDFEGEPLRPLDERRTKHMPFRDVAGMLRSLQYVSATLQQELPAALSSEARSLEVNRLNKWAVDASAEFVNSYLSSLRELSPQPVDTAAAHSIVEFFLIEKALYEVLYELSNRPTWTSVPLRYLVSQLAQLKRRSES